MRSPSPAFVIASVLVALAATAAEAQSVRSTPRVVTSGAATATTTSGARVSTGTVSNASTGGTGVTAGTTGSSATGTTATNGTAATNQAFVPSRGGAAPVTTPAPAALAAGSSTGNGVSSNAVTNNAGNFIINPDGTVTVVANNASTTNALDVVSDTRGVAVNNTTSTNNAANGAAANSSTTTGNATGSAALGRSPGQTSSGTATGNSSAGLNAPSNSLGVQNGNTAANTANANTAATSNVGAFNSGVLLGGVAGIAASPDLGASADTGNGVNANGERSVSMGGFGGSAGTGNGGNATMASAAPQVSVATTPIYDAATKAATARELNRRARGETPRIIGIAPRTDRDLSNQMPDDPIIRY